MKVITSSEIIYSNAFGKRRKKDSSEKPSEKETKKGGFFSKEKRDSRQEKRAERKEDRVVRRAERRAKRGSRPLKTYTKNGKQWFKDHLPKVRKKADGSFEKVNNDGTITPVKDVLKLPKTDVLIDKLDANTKNVVTEIIGGVPQAVVDYSANEVTAIDGDTGGVEYYKNEDLEEVGMSKQTKTLLIVGGVVVGLAILGFVIYKYKKGKK